MPARFASLSKISRRASTASLLTQLAAAAFLALGIFMKHEKSEGERCMNETKKQIKRRVKAEVKWHVKREFKEHFKKHFKQSFKRAFEKHVR